MAAAPSTLAAFPPERRAAPRTPVLHEGRILTVEGLGPEVLIVDVSETGALVRLRAPVSLPQDLVLIDRRTQTAHRAVVARRRDLELGLRFLKSQSLGGPVPSALLAAKAWCAPS